MLCFAYNNFFFSDSPSRFKFFSLVISQWMGLWDKDWRWGGGVLRNNFQRQSLGGGVYCRTNFSKKTSYCKKATKKNPITRTISVAIILFCDFSWNSAENNDFKKILRNRSRTLFTNLSDQVHVLLIHKPSSGTKNYQDAAKLNSTSTEHRFQSWTPSDPRTERWNIG